MTFLVECFPNCRHKFHVQDEIFGEHEYQCPRCGKHPSKLIPTLEQIRNRIPIRHIGTGTLVPLGHEHRAVFDEGYYLRDREGKPIMVDYGTPRFG